MRLVDHELPAPGLIRETEPVRLYRYIERHYRAAAICFGFALLAVLVVVAPVIFAR